MRLIIKEVEINDCQMAILAINGENEIVARNWYSIGYGASHTNQREARTELIDELQKDFPGVEIDARMYV